MATASDILLDGLGRVRETAHGLLDDVPEEHLTAPPASGTNTIAWLVWHLTRVIDEHVADAFDVDVVWTTSGWFDRFGLPFPAGVHGYGMTYDDVLRVRASAEDLRGYLDDAFAVAEEQLRRVSDDDLDRIVDESWDPPVSLGVRLLSMINDATQHIGQAAYAAGILARS
jgi:uncharacterized damage-inducible protein DinB